MKTAVLSDGAITVRDVPEPPLAPDHVMVRVRACGICGSDLRYMAGENPWAQHTLGVRKPNPPRMVPGHEVAGEIVAVGDPAMAHRIGERVVMMAFRGDDTCYYCRRGFHNLCENTSHLGHAAGWAELDLNPGGMAELCPIWAENAYTLPDSISFEDATLLDGAGVALHAVHVGGVQSGEPVAVTGCGSIGLLIVQVAKALGAGPVVAIDVADKPLALAGELGADLVLNARESDVAAAVTRATDGLGAATSFDTVGADATIAQSLCLLRRGGTAVMLAVELRDAKLPMSCIAGERGLRVAANFAYDEFPEVIEMMAAGQIRGGPMITHVFPLDETPRAFETARAKAQSGAIKVVIQP
ncbi:MAG: alcohol dehydrogenase catalytic domain-containing protein [Armatimonadota bacterium]|nr:MAG: alcohol dehydrogenase catalytic domain-containing protein [Armatimonadota bacterium]